MKISLKKRISTLTMSLLAIAATHAQAAAAPVNYDTAWTFVYDGTPRNGKPSNDRFFDVKVLPNGTTLCAGISSDTSYSGQTILLKLSATGTLLFKKLYNTKSSNMSYNRQSAHSLAIAKNGDYILGGERYLCPWVMRLDTLGNIKWSTWYYDSVRDQSFLLGNGTINSVRETKRGTIICAAGDEYPNNGGQALSNYAACLEFAAEGKITKGNQWDAVVGYNIGGFSIEETSTGYYILGGNQAVYYLDTNGTAVWKKKYTFSLTGVGTVTNNVNRVKMLRDGSLMVAGQAYEGNCWTNWQRFYYDAWHSPISYAYGVNASWDTAGYQGGSDGLYDFAQLTNGNLVFIGTKATPTAGGIWAFITDSTGKNFLWEKQVSLPGKDSDGNPLTNLLPLSVCATSDTGFTLVGDNNTFGNNHNAFAMHFVPKAMSVILKTPVSQSAKPTVRYKISGSGVSFTCDYAGSSPISLVIYNAQGKTVARIAGAGRRAEGNPLVWDCSHSGKGVYFYRLTTSQGTFTDKIVLER